MRFPVSLFSLSLFFLNFHKATFCAAEQGPKIGLGVCVLPRGSYLVQNKKRKKNVHSGMSARQRAIVPGPSKGAKESH